MFPTSIEKFGHISLVYERVRSVSLHFVMPSCKGKKGLLLWRSVSKFPQMVAEKPFQVMVAAGWMTALSLLSAAPRNMYWLRMSAEKVAVGLHASSDGAGAGAVVSSARTAIKGKEIVKNRIAHTSTFFLIPVAFISFAPFLMLGLESPFSSVCFCQGATRRLRVPHFLSKAAMSYQ